MALALHIMTMMKECLAKNIYKLAQEAHRRYLKELPKDVSEEKKKNWKNLSDDKKYSNIRQIMTIELKLESIDCFITDDPEAKCV